MPFGFEVRAQGVIQWRTVFIQKFPERGDEDGRDATTPQTHPDEQGGI
jgi:hypothetical protein